MNMIKLFTFSFLLICVVSPGITYSADVARIGIVDYQRILKESSAGKDIARKLRQKQDERASALENRKAEIVNIQKWIDSPEHSGDKDREKKKQELSRKLETFRDEESRYNGQLRDLNNQQAGAVRDSIVQIIDRIGKKGGYLLIVEKSDVLYAPASTDITNQVIEEYDMAYKGSR